MGGPRTRYCHQDYCPPYLPKGQDCLSPRGPTRCCGSTRCCRSTRCLCLPSPSCPRRCCCPSSLCPPSLCPQPYWPPCCPWQCCCPMELPLLNSTKKRLKQAMSFLSLAPVRRLTPLITSLTSTHGV